jgi:ribosomal-protein-alanine N-acetyltransferase
MTAKQKILEQNIPIRWMIDRDLHQIVPIEQSSFEFPWSYEELYACKWQRNIVPLVAEIGDLIVAYMFYELHKSYFGVPSIAVHPDFRRQGIGRKMVTRLINRIPKTRRRRRIKLEVRETNVPAQLFYSNLGFRATKVLRKRYFETGEDAYEMVYECRASK